MEIATKKLPRVLALFALVALLTVALFGISSSMMGMEIRNDGTMGDCPFMGNAVICKMTVGEHISIWQSMFTSIPVKSNVLSLLVLALVFLILASSFLKRYFIWALERMAALQKLYLIHQPERSLSNSLQEAFSQGILNPKIY